MSRLRRAAGSRGRGGRRRTARARGFRRGFLHRPGGTRRRSNAAGPFRLFALLGGRHTQVTPVASRCGDGTNLADHVHTGPRRPNAGMGANGSQNTLARATARLRTPKAAICPGARFLFAARRNLVAGSPIGRRGGDLIEYISPRGAKIKDNGWGAPPSAPMMCDVSL